MTRQDRTENRNKLRFLFRNAAHSDKEAVLALFREENRLARQQGKDSALGPPYPQAFDDFVNRQKNGEGRYQCEVIQTESGQIVGYVRALHRLTRKEPDEITKPHGKQTTLHKLAVKAEFQGCGLGRTLVEMVKTRAQTLNREVIRISLPEGNPLVFYEKLGFKKVATVPGRDRDLNLIDLTL